MSPERQPTQAEWKILRIIREHGPCAARDVVARAAEDPGWSTSTTKTLLRRLVDKGHLKTKRVGNSFVYRVSRSVSRSLRQAAGPALGSCGFGHRGAAPGVSGEEEQAQPRGAQGAARPSRSRGGRVMGTFLNDVGAAWLDWVLDRGIAAAVVFASVAAIIAVLGSRMSVHLKSWLWLVPLVPLVIPLDRWMPGVEMAATPRAAFEQVIGAREPSSAAQRPSPTAPSLGWQDCSVG